jgi:hypothetical protein
MLFLQKLKALQVTFSIDERFFEYCPKIKFGCLISLKIPAQFGAGIWGPAAWDLASTNFGQGI